MTQEYVNLSETLFALLTTGLQLRLVRDSSRLIKLSYLEFNLERIFEDELFTDFALLYRLLHISRWAAEGGNPAESLLETYHQDSLENGSRIRDKLSEAVVDALETWAEGLLIHPDNNDLRAALREGVTWSTLTCCHAGLQNLVPPSSRARPDAPSRGPRRLQERTGSILPSMPGPLPPV